jgi:putative effector of murein hydrolase LrgA (UPF0299 family)
MSKKFWIAFPVSFVLFYLLELVLHVGILSGFYAANPEGFLSEEAMQSRIWCMVVGMIILTFLWTYFFSRFASEKTVGKGIQHGISYMLFLFVPTGFINYAVMTVSGWAFFWWAVGGIVEGAIVGAVMGAIMKEKAAAVPPVSETD